MTHWAPAAILRTSLKYCGISSRSWRLNGETTQPMKKLVFGSVSGLPPRPSTLSPSFIDRSSVIRPTESKSNTGSARPPKPPVG